MKILEDACKVDQGNSLGYLRFTYGGSDMQVGLLPTEVIDQILKWRDEAYKLNAVDALLDARERNESI